MSESLETTSEVTDDQEKMNNFKQISCCSNYFLLFSRRFAHLFK